MKRRIGHKIQGFLTFDNQEGACGRIEALEAENRQIIEVMRELSDHFREVICEPREIYLSIQEVRSMTVYIRWRKKGAKGKQSYLVMNGIEGRAFMLRQSKVLQSIYQEFNQMALDLNLAHSLRLNGVRRLRQYLRDLQ